MGRWGRSLVNAVHGKTDAIQFTAAYTRTRASAEEFCREKNIPLLDRFEDALADPNIDAVVLATPHSQHAEQVMAAAVAGKHIHVEKPLTLDRPSAEAAVAAAKQRRHRAGGRLQPALPSLGGGDPQAPRRRPARHR